MDKERAEQLLEACGYGDYRWLDPGQIQIAHWVRMKCRYGCGSYGQCASCPPNVPTLAETRAFFDEYSRALVLRFSGEVAADERHQWSRQINLELLKLERQFFLAGCYKAFLLFMDNCSICAECAPTRVECKLPKMSRPSPEGLGVDVFATVRSVGYPLEVLSDFDQPMNRYAFLLID